MQSINLENMTLFAPILDFTIGEEHIDLHNDYDCQNIVELADKREVALYFNHTKHHHKKIVLLFGQAKITTTKHLISDTSRSVTLSNFHRGKFTTEGNDLLEINNEGQKYFYLDFSEGQQMKIFAKTISLSTENLEDFSFI